ncbi:hypothetical protein KKF84_05725, partial [Myxococcota bacterium]|nr:hypothetical protein [Myxococcota bacterium]
MRYISILILTFAFTACHVVLDIADHTNNSNDGCGNGIREIGEACDIDDLNNQTCQTMGYQFGALSCNAQCEFDTSDCDVLLNICGNAIVEAGEQCDSNNLGGATCDSLGYGSGDLSCLDCYFNVSGCSEAPTCGDEIIDAPAEECEGTDLNGSDCGTLGYAGGTLACDELCHFDRSGCSGGTCGNGTVDTGEECDGSNLNQSSCELLGFSDGGTLSCSDSCTFVTSECAGGGTCGDGTLDTTEECDGTDFNGETCVTQGFPGGSLSCSDQCTIDTSTCDPLAQCGNSIVETGEECDGSNLGGGTCGSLGYWFGALDCSSCSYDETHCRDAVVSGTAAHDLTYSSVITPAGEIIQAGYVSGTSFYGHTALGGEDCVLIKYNLDGTVGWTAQWGSSENDRVLGLAQDQNGNLYAVGQTFGVMDGQAHAGSVSRLAEAHRSVVCRDHRPKGILDLALNGWAVRLEPQHA